APPRPSGDQSQRPSAASATAPPPAARGQRLRAGGEADGLVEPGVEGAVTPVLVFAASAAGALVLTAAGVLGRAGGGVLGDAAVCAAVGLEGGAGGGMVRNAAVGFEDGAGGGMLGKYGGSIDGPGKMGVASPSCMGGAVGEPTSSAPSRAAE